MQAGLEIQIKQENWKEAAANASNLSGLQLISGSVPDAITAAQQSVELADKFGDVFYLIVNRTTLADAQHQAGEWAKARELIEKAESLQKERQPKFPQLHSLQGFLYCDLLLTAGKWQEVQQLSEQAYEYRYQGWYSPLDIALYPLSLGRANLQQAISITVKKINETLTNQIVPDTLVFTILSSDNKMMDDANLSTIQTAKSWLNQAVDSLRKAGAEEFVMRGLLARACYFRFCLRIEEKKSLNFALADLQETHDIAQRGGMLLPLCDYHLESARLALTINETVFKQTASEHIQKAKQLIEETGYKRRLPEVEYLEAFLNQNRNYLGRSL